MRLDYRGTKSALARTLDKCNRDEYKEWEVQYGGTIMGISTIDVLQVLLSPSRRRIISTAERLGWVVKSRSCLCGDLPESGQSELSHRDCRLVRVITISVLSSYQSIITSAKFFGSDK